MQMIVNKRSAKRILHTILNEYLVVCAIFALIVITALVEPKFLLPANLTNLMRQFGPLAFVSLGMTFIILAGYIDLSAAGMFSLIAVVTITISNQYGEAPAILAGLAIGVVLGMLNGALILFFGAQNSSGALFITYGLSILYGALALIYTSGATVYLGDGFAFLTLLGKGSLGIVPISFIAFFIALLVLYGFQKKTYMGESVRLMGGNPVAARLAGIPVDKSIFLVYTICGLMTAVGAIVFAARVASASPTSGSGYETDAIMSVVIGGTSLSGGKGSVLRTVLGCAIVTLMSNCLNLLGVSAHMQDCVQGCIMILAIWLDNRSGTIGGVLLED